MNYTPREHKSGAITCAVYLVDLLCLGVKDSFYQQNISFFEYKDIIEKYKTNESFQKIDYALAHNIIFSGHDFALDLNIKPCKTFSDVTKFILEEDNDNIELIDIECGRNGIPVVLKGPQNISEANKTINHLKHKIGEENFILHHADDMDDDYWEDEDDEDEDEDGLFNIDIENYIYSDPILEYNQDVNDFKQLSNKLSEHKPEDAAQVLAIAKRLFYNHFGSEVFDESEDDVRSFFISKIDVEPSFDYIGVDPNMQNTTDVDIKELLVKACQMEAKELKKLIKVHPKIPVFKFLMLLCSADEKLKTQYKLAEEYVKTHPDYILLKIKRDELALKNNKPCHIINNDIFQQSTINELFNNRQQLFPDEVRAVFHAFIAYFINNEDVVTLHSMIKCFDEILDGYFDDQIQLNVMLNLFIIYVVKNLIDDIK